jgi:hypothetical protein
MTKVKARSVLHIHMGHGPVVNSTFNFFLPKGNKKRARQDDSDDYTHKQHREKRRHIEDKISRLTDRVEYLEEHVEQLERNVGFA